MTVVVAAPAAPKRTKNVQNIAAAVITAALALAQAQAAARTR